MIKVIARYEDSKFGDEVMEQFKTALSGTPETHNGLTLWSVEKSEEGVITVNFGTFVDNKDVAIDLGLVNLVDRSKKPEEELEELETVEEELDKVESTEVTEVSPETMEKTNEIIEQTLEQSESSTEERESAEELPTATTRESTE